jgi:hypothetical protein
VIDANNFTLHIGGRITGLSGLAMTFGIYFLSDTVAGTLTLTEPTTVGAISKPLLIADSSTSGYFYNFRGTDISLPASALSFDMSLNRAGNSVTLDGDADAPGANQLYGTNPSSIKGFFNRFGAGLSIGGTPPATSSVAGVMMGLGANAKITPVSSGRVLAILTCSLACGTANTGGSVQLLYGTGTPPAFGAAVTGSAFGGGTALYNNTVAGLYCPCSAVGVIGGLVLGTQYWFDVRLSCQNANPLTLSSPVITLVEI